MSAFANDEADLVQVAGYDATWLAYDDELGPRLHAAEPLTISYFGFDTTRPPFDDARVRLAFALALERDRLVPLAEGSGAQAAASQPRNARPARARQIQTAAYDGIEPSQIPAEAPPVQPEAMLDGSEHKYERPH